MFGDIKAVFFDLDMTLWDHQKAQSATLKIICERYAIDFAKMDKAYAEVNEEYWERFLKKEMDVEEMRTGRFREVFSRMGTPRPDYLEIARDYLKTYPQCVYLIDGAVETLDSLSRHFEIGILTNGFSDTQNAKVNNTPLKQFITHHFSITETQSFKPEREFFDYGRRVAGCRAEELVYIGDNYMLDIVGAKNAGWKAIWYNPKNLSVPQSDVAPDFIVDRLADILPILLTDKKGMHSDN